MNKTGIALGFAAAVGLAATLGAQSSTTTTASRPAAAGDHEVTISGCLSKAAAGYMLTSARVEPNASASTTTAPGATSTTGTSTTTTAGAATTTAGAATTTAGATGTTGEAPAAASPAMTWMLSGDSDLEKHVGHKIQVTGKTSWQESAPTATSSTTTTAGASANHPHLDVKSIKMVSTNCS